MKTKQFTLLAIAVLTLSIMSSASLFAQKEKAVTVGGALMYPSKNIIQNAVNSKAHTTLVAAVKAADLVETLSSSGPFTVFAPTNKAFEKLPEGTVQNLLKPEQKKMLTTILTYHVVPGKISSKELMSMIEKGNGKASLKTVEGGELTFMIKDDKIWVMDEKGGKAQITIKDVYQSNGVIHVINSVLMPE